MLVRRISVFSVYIVPKNFLLPPGCLFSGNNFPGDVPYQNPENSESHEAFTMYPTYHARIWLGPTVRQQTGGVGCPAVAVGDQLRPPAFP